MSVRSHAGEPALPYAARIGVAAPRQRTGRDTIDACRHAAVAAAMWLKGKLRERAPKTKVDWELVACASDPDQAMAHAMSSALRTDSQPLTVPPEWLVESSEFIVAIWPDNAADRCPSIEALIREALGSGRKVVAVDPSAPSAHLRWLVSSGGKSRQIRACEMPRHRPEISMGFVRVSAFNRECTVSAARLGRAGRNRRKSLSDAGARYAMAPDETEPICESLVPLATKAEFVAQRYKGRYLGTIVLTHVLAAAAVGAVVVQAIFIPSATWPALFEIAAMLAVLILVCLAGARFWHERFIYGRYVAEQLRQATYAAFAGLDPTEAFRSQSEHRPFLWGADEQLASSVRRLIKPVIDKTSARLAAGNDAERIARLARFLHDELIEDQREWHLRNARRRHARLRLTHGVTYALFAATILMAILHASHVGASARNGPDHGAAAPHSAVAADAHGGRLEVAPAGWRRIDLWITALAILMPLCAGTLHGISRYLDDERLARRSEHIAHALGSMHAEAEGCRTQRELGRLLTNASNVMAAELYDWLVETSFRRPEVVV